MPRLEDGLVCLVAAMLGNGGDFVGIDDFSMGAGSRDLLEAPLGPRDPAGDVERVPDGVPHMALRALRRVDMAKYLLQGAYTLDGAKGLLKDGGSKRRAAIEEMLKSLGGKLEAFCFAFGETDAFGIADVPDNVSASAISLTIGTSGAARVKTTVLLTPEEVDQAVKKAVKYHAPGK